MGLAAYVKKVKISTDGIAWVDVPTNSPTLNFQADVLDDTELATNQGYRTKCIGLIDWSVNADSIYSPTDTTLQTIRTAMLARDTLFLQYLPDGTVANGFQGAVVVESFSLSGDVGGLETVSVTFQAAGALEPAV